jgi:hypothetical protein
MEPTQPHVVTTDSVRLAIEAPAQIATRAAFTISQLLASACIAVGRTGSVILPWPCSKLPLDPAAWSKPQTHAETDPIAFAFHRLTANRSQPACEVDRVRDLVREWALAERLRVGSPWPEPFRFAVAIIHHDQRPAAGIRERLRRRNRLTHWEHVARIDQRWKATSHLGTVPQEHRTELAALGLVDTASAAVAIEPTEPFSAGTAYPYRLFDLTVDRPAATIALPVAIRGDADAAIHAITTTGRIGGGFAIVLEHREPEDADRYEAVLRSAQLSGAWCTSPATITGRLPL